MAAAPSPGARIADRYELRREIGRGGMGSVFEARHVYTGRAVALKLLHPEYAHVADLRDRLLQEAQVLGAIAHPNVVQVADAGLDREGVPYVALEMLQGRSLEGILAARGSISIEDTVHVGRQLCDALAAVHACGVVHRDIKPGNVFLVRDALGHEAVKLLDFGIAMLPEQRAQAGASAGARKKLTGANALVGTPEYMPREQILAEPVDHRADIYAAGITLFECLTGEVPFQGELAQVLPKLALSTPVPAVSTLRPEVSGALDAVLERALMHDASGRFPDAATFGRVLLAASGLEASGRSTLLGLEEMSAAAQQATPSGTMPAVVPDGGDAPVLLRKKTPPIALQRRRYPRAPYVTPVQLIRTDGTSVEARSEEISELGMLLVGEHEFAVGDMLFVRFAMPQSGEAVVIQGKTQWTRPARGRIAIGLEFTQKLPDVRRAINRYVLSLAAPAAPR